MLAVDQVVRLGARALPGLLLVPGAWLVHVGHIFAPEGVPIVPLAAGIPKTAPNPNAARLFLDWLLSPEGQGYVMREQGSVSSLKTWPVSLPGFDPAKDFAPVTAVSVRSAGMSP